MRRPGSPAGVTQMLALLLFFKLASAVRTPPPADIVFSGASEINPHDRPGYSLNHGDPRFNITCLGAHSDIPWSLEPALTNHYDGRSMQKLCALRQYGGQEDSGPNLGGYCQGDDVAFQYGAWWMRFTRTPGYVKHIRSFLECRSRCFCNYNLENPLEQPKLNPITRKTFSGPLRNEPAALTIPVDRKIPAGRSRPALLTRVLFKGVQPLPYQGNDVGILATNMIECGGSLPQFGLPGPWAAEEFANNQELCAVQLSGGKSAANAGGYCYRDGTIGKAVAFADDMTPRWDWTWNPGGTFLEVASLRFHCWKNCLCQPPSRKKNYNDPLLPMWDFILSRMPKDAIVTKGNRNPLGSSTDARGNIKTSAAGRNQPAAQCAATPGDSDPGTCKIPWPTDIMGPVPDSVAKLAPPQPPAPNLDENKQCGNRCDSNSDCGSDCLCKIPSTQEAQLLGVDPVPAIAFCITLASVFG